VAWLEEMPSVQTQGEILAEAKENLKDAFQLAVAYLRDQAQSNASKSSVREPFEVVL